MINWDKIRKIDDCSPSFLVGEFKIEGYRGLNSISIKIWENPYLSSPYTGECEYGFWGPKQASPYCSMHPQNTIEEAFNDAFFGLTSFDSKDFPNELVFFEKHTTNGSIYYDGNGEEVSLDEIMERRKDYQK